MTPERSVVELPADMYDALELSAYAFGGIGAFHFSDMGETDDTEDGVTLTVEICPRCVIGHARWAENDYSGNGTIENTLREQGLRVDQNDSIVSGAFGVNYDDNVDAEEQVQKRRLSWKKYVKLANIVRVED